MRTLLLLLLSAITVLGQGTPNFVKNPWSTNVPPNPVFGSNNLSISNKIVGGNGSNWLFYGIGPRTVAGLGDVQSIVSQSNLWQKIGTILAPTIGPSNIVLNAYAADDGTSTNFTFNSANSRVADGTQLFSVGNRTNPVFIISKDGGLMLGPNTLLLNGTPAQNGNFLIIYRDVSRGDADNFSIDVEQFDGSNLGRWLLNGSTPTVSETISSKISGHEYIVEWEASGQNQECYVQLVVDNALKFLCDETGRVYLPSNGVYGFTVTDDASSGIDTGIFRKSVGVIGTTNLYVQNTQTNNGTLDVAGTVSTYAGINDIGGLSESGISSFSTGVKFPSMTAGKFADYVTIGGATYLSNSVYGDTDIATIISGLGNTNLYVKIQSGTANNLTSTNGNFISATNTTGASNQVVLTLKGLTGQNTNLLEVLTNTTSTKTVIDAQGRIGINTNVPSHTLEVGGRITAGPGASQAPSYGFNTADTFGMYARGSGFITFTRVSDGDIFELSSSGASLKSTMNLGWSPSTIGQVDDTRISRSGANTNSFGLATGTGNIITSNAIFNGVVGIGTTTPAAKLDVSGASHFSSNVTNDAAPILTLATNYISFSATNVAPASTTPKVWITVTIGGATYWIGGCQ